MSLAATCRHTSEPPSYTLRNGVRYEQPAVFVVEVRDGRVTRHWDFVDYTVGPVGQGRTALA